MSSWRRHGGTAAWLGALGLAVLAAARFRAALPHLLRDVAPWSAVDLKYRYGEVAAWFAGGPVYSVVDGAVYPPASHAILWPFLGWLPLDGARAVWAATMVVAGVALAALVYALCAPARPRDRLLIALLALAAYPFQQSVYVGQLGVHVVAFAAAGAWLAFRSRDRIAGDVLAGILLAASLVKPTLSAPLVVAALIGARRARPALLTAVAYASFTLIAAAAQPEGLVGLVRGWLAVAGVRVPFMDGVPNLHMLLAAAGLHAWMTPASLLLLGGAAVWFYVHRDSDPWLLMGVAGIVARLWAHSASYDDMFLLLAVLALFRQVLRAEGSGTGGPMLLVLGAAALLTPTWAFHHPAIEVRVAVHVVHTVLWVAVLGWLVSRGRQAHPSGGHDARGL